jgi:hypothetical protein
MALSRKARLWSYIIGIPVGIIIILALAAKIYFTNDRLKAMVVPALTDATHRTVSVGDLSLTLFPSIGISIDSLKISNPAGEGFQTPEFLSLGNCEVRVKLFPLIGGKIEVKKVLIDHLVVYLEVTKNGKKNSKFGTGTPEAAPSAGTTTSGPSIAVSDLEIRDGRIESINRKLDSRFLIDNLNASATVTPRADDGALVVDASAKIGGFSYGTVASWLVTDQPVSADARLAYRMSQDVLALEKVDAKLKDIPLTVTGTVSQLKQETMMLDIAVAAPSATMAQVLSLVPPDLLKAAKGMTSEGTVSLKALVKGPSSDIMAPAVNAEFSLSNGSIRYASLPKAITGINVHGIFDQPSAPIERKDLGRFELDKFSATLGGSTIEGHCSASNFVNPTVNLGLKGGMNLAEVKDYYPLEQGSQMSGQVNANVSVDGKPKPPQSLKAAGSVEFRNVMIQTAGSPKPVKNLNGAIAFNNQSIDAKQLALNIGESDMNVSFSLKNYLGLVMHDSTAAGGKPTATFTLNSNQLRTADIMSEPAASAAPAKNAPATKKSGNGLLPGIDANASVNIGKLVTDKFTFTNAKGDLGISNGIVDLKEFSVNAFNGSIQTKGTLDLRDTTKRPFNLNLIIDNVESNAMLPSFTSFGNYLHGKLSMTTTMKGDLDDTLGLNRKTLLGDGNVHITDGKIEGMPMMEKLSGLTNLSELKQVVFKDWMNAFSIENGRVVVKNLIINAGTTTFLVGGSQGLDGTLDYTITTKLPASVSDRLTLPGIAKELMPLLKDKEGRINLSFAAGGTASSPNVRLDTQAQQNLLKLAAEQKKQQLLDDAKKKAQDALQNLFKH